MSKFKIRIGLFIALSLIGLVIGFFFAGYLNLLLSGGNMSDISALYPAAIIKSISVSERHAALTLWTELIIIAGVSALMLVGKKETFESDTSAIAGEIHTPIAIGQGQHGTARWLRKTELAKAFSIYRLDDSEQKFNALLNAGARDRKEVKDYDAAVSMAETPENEKAEASQ